MVTIALRLDPTTRAKLELLAKATGWSRAALVAEAVRRFVDAGMAELAAEIRTQPPQKDEDEPAASSEGWNIIV